MTAVNNTKVLIGGNVYTLSGDESEEYIQRVALYINNKLDEIKLTDNARQLNTRLLSVLLDINIADDYFKAKEVILELNQTIDQKDHSIREIEKEKVALEEKIESLNSDKNVLNKTINDLKSEMDSLRAELNEYLDMFDEDK